MKSEYSAVIRDIISEEKKALPEKTLRYWKLTRCWNGVDTSKMNVGDALTHIRNLQAELNPQRPLNFSLCVLKDNIIQHGTKTQLKKYMKKQRIPEMNAKITLL